MANPQLPHHAAFIFPVSGSVPCLLDARANARQTPEAFCGALGIVEAASTPRSPPRNTGAIIHGVVQGHGLAPGEPGGFRAIDENAFHQAILPPRAPASRTIGENLENLRRETLHH